MVKRMIGKPRRCSPAFFAEERAQLATKRSLVRQLQQQIQQGTVSQDSHHPAALTFITSCCPPSQQLTLSDYKQYTNLPDSIPSVLTLGTKVLGQLFVSDA